MKPITHLICSRCHRSVPVREVRLDSQGGAVVRFCPECWSASHKDCPPAARKRSFWDVLSGIFIAGWLFDSGGDNKD